MMESRSKQSQRVFEGGRRSAGCNRRFVERTSYAQIMGANDRVRVGIVGCGDRMKGGDLRPFSRMPRR